MSTRTISALALFALLAGCAGSTGGPVPPANGSGLNAMQRGSSPMRPSSYTMQVNPTYPVTKNCPSAKYAFCIAVSSQSPGPYFNWSACNGSSCPSIYEMSANTAFYSKSGKEISYHKISWYQRPGPGNPDYVYIYEGKHPYKVSNGHVKIVGKTQACYYYYPSECSSWITFGIMFD